MRNRLPRLAAALALVLTATAGCRYIDEVNSLIDNGGAKPWYCDPVAPNSVTGPGMGTVDYYAGQSRPALDWDTCKQLASQMDQAYAYSKQFPTAGDAWAAGFRTTFTYLPGMGTHTGLRTVTPELLADPNFNPLDPIIPGSETRAFNPAEPEFLQYDGNGPDAKLIGMSWYVRTTNGLPPAGFAGPNDWWHHHPRLCFRKTDAIIIGVNGSDSGCAASGGVNLHTEKYFMVHLWVAAGLEYRPDVFAPTYPCIGSSSVNRDRDAACNQPPAGSRPPDGSAGGAAAARFAATDPNVGICPLGTITLDEHVAG